MAAKRMTEVFRIREAGERKKVPLEQARGKYLWVNQAMEDPMFSPYGIQQKNVKYDQLPPEPFARGYVRVDNNPNPSYGWTTFRIENDGSLKFHKTSVDSSG